MPRQDIDRNLNRTVSRRLRKRDEFSSENDLEDNDLFLIRFRWGDVDDGEDCADKIEQDEGRSRAAILKKSGSGQGRVS